MFFINARVELIAEVNPTTKDKEESKRSQAGKGHLFAVYFQLFAGFQGLKNV